MSEVRYLIVRDAAGKTVFAGRGVVEFPDDDEAKVRQDRVDAVREQIADGTCVTVGKLEMTADRVVDEINRPQASPHCIGGKAHKLGVDGLCLGCGIRL